MGIGPWLGRLRERVQVPWAVRGALRRIEERLEELDRRVRSLQEAGGRIEERQTRSLDGTALQDREFRVFSQWGEDGIIQHLVREVPVPAPVFLEIGVETYEEANTRFLLLHDNWSGVVVDGSAWCIDRIRSSRAYWLHDLEPVNAFVTRENVNEIVRSAGLDGPIGLLSIDVDGMDFWLWEALDAVDPAIVVIEYNHRFGPELPVTVPYRPDFDRREAHPSILWYGASLTALCRLGERKGYDFVGAGSAGLNAFFVRKDLRPPSLPVRDPREDFVAGRFREAHDEEGRRVRLSLEEEARLVRELPLVEVGADGRARS
jgi:hypothetical protein